MKRFISFLLVILMCLTFVSPSTASAATAKINKTKLTLNVGKTYTLKITGTTGAVKWSSSDKEVAKVSTKGKVTAVAKGSTTITATVSDTAYKCKVTVKDPDVEVIFSYMNMDGTSNEEYLKSIEEENSEYLDVNAYDDDHYAVIMPESLRLSMLSAFNSEINPQIESYLADPTFGAMITDIKYNDLLSEITVYADKKDYNEASSLYTILAFAILSDYYQALKLVDIDDRYLLVNILDKDTKKVLYTYDSRTME